MPEVGAGSTDLMLVTIMILRSDVVEKVCRVGCGSLDDVYASQDREVPSYPSKRRESSLLESEFCYSYSVRCDSLA